LLSLLEKSLEIRVGLAVAKYDEEGEVLPPPMMLSEYKPPKISQLVHMKLILTTLAKDKKSQVSKKKKEHKVRSERICTNIVSLMESMPRGLIKNPIKRAAIVGNYC
jgi:hypothetical protein